MAGGRGSGETQLLLSECISALENEVLVFFFFFQIDLMTLGPRLFLLWPSMLSNVPGVRESRRAGWTLSDPPIPPLMDPRTVHHSRGL